MAKFSSGARDASRGGHQKEASRDGNLSIVAQGMRVIGEVTCDGVVKIEGVVEGTVRAERQVLVAKDGIIEGDVYTREAVIGGRVIGSVFADERVEVQPGSTVRGDIVTQRLVVQEGGEVNGNVQMGNPKALEKAARKPQETGEPEAHRRSAQPAQYGG
jgi:cytoskeletal protein CcmA (bactofilin family)